MARALTPVLVLLLSLLLVAGPAPAQEAGDVLQPCANAGTAEVVTPEGLQTGIDTPTEPLWGVTGSPGTQTQKSFILDLTGNPVADNRATVDVTMTWDIPVEDYDLDLLDAYGGELAHSEMIQPIDGDSEHVAAVLRHCDRFSAAALNWTAAGLSELTLELAASTL
jgi:hypothetical protein